MQIVRAIDVGYGNTKFTAFRQGPKEIHCGLFPSIAPQASSIPDLGGELFQKRNTALIEVNGVQYEVGKDAMIAADSSYGRTLDENFAMTDSYIALARGAIYYMSVDHIDLLVLGLPVNTFEAKRVKLEARMVGVHKIPGPKRTSAEPTVKEVHVRQVRVLPQPIGAFFDYSLRNQAASDMRQQVNLVIDPGYYTLDWVVANGVKVVSARSGAHSGGMSAVVAAIAEEVGRKLKTQITDVSPIDEALRTGRNPRFFGKEFDLEKYLPIGKAKAQQFVSVLANKVGSAASIDNILLAGGGAPFFHEIIADKFPHHEIRVTDEPVYANVRGFQFAGEQMARAAKAAA